MKVPGLFRNDTFHHNTKQTPAVKSVFGQTSFTAATRAPPQLGALTMQRTCHRCLVFNTCWLAIWPWGWKASSSTGVSASSSSSADGQGRNWGIMFPTFGKSGKLAQLLRSILPMAGAESTHHQRLRLLAQMSFKSSTHSHLQNPVLWQKFLMWCCTKGSCCAGPTHSMTTSIARR